MLVGNTGHSPGSFDLIQTHILTGTESQIDFSNLSSYSNEYYHLQLRGVTKTNSSNYIGLRVNGYSGTYPQHYLESTANSTDSYYTSNLSALGLGVTYNDIYCGFICDILDAFHPNKATVIRSLSAQHSRGATFFSGFHPSIEAVDSLTVVEQYGSSFVAGSRFSIYGQRKVA
jgi:hypothetical protein